MPIRARGLANSRQVAREVALLALIEPSDADFISCYLDARGGRAACRRRLMARAERIRSGLSGHERIDFDDAMALIDARLEAAWHPAARGYALFARGLGGGRYLGVLELAVPVADRLVRYRAPQILPLLDLLERTPRFTLVLARRPRVQTLDIDLGIASPRAALAAGPTPDRRDSVTPPSTAPAALVRGPGPLLVAGESGLIEAACAGLPQPELRRLVACLTLANHLEQRAAIDSAIRHLAGVHAAESLRLAHRLVQTVRGHGPAVAGPAASRAALRDGRVETLVIAATGLDGAPARIGPAIDAAREASQQGVRVVVADSDALSDLGGVGGLLGRRGDRRAIPRPVELGRLDLVA